VRPDRRREELAERLRHRRSSRLQFALGSAFLLFGLGLFMLAAVTPYARLFLLAPGLLLIVAGLPLVAVASERLLSARRRDREDIEAF